MINDLPTVFEVVTEKKPAKDKPSVDSGSKSRGGSTKVSWAFSENKWENFKIKPFLMPLNNLYPMWYAAFIFTLCCSVNFGV